jgi:hypothetical protein
LPSPSTVMTCFPATAKSALGIIFEIDTMLTPD